MKINENFELNYDGCWTVVEWKDGFKTVDGERVPTRTIRKSYYSDLVNACGCILDRSAGNACSESRNIIDAVKHAKKDIHEAICKGGWNA